MLQGSRIIFRMNLRLVILETFAYRLFLLLDIAWPLPNQLINRLARYFHLYPPLSILAQEAEAGQIGTIRCEI